MGEAESEEDAIAQTKTECAKLPPQAALYLDLLERAVSGQLIEDPSTHPGIRDYDRASRIEGTDWPQYAHTMVGVRRLRQLRNAVEQVLQEGVPGDLLEAGVWRGGACILMRGILAAYGVSDRKIWACDSFQGLPAPSGRFEEDAGDKSHTYPQLSVPLERVRANFSNYGLLDDQVIFVEGWFKDTLRNIARDTFAVIRLDGDMYESTHDALEGLYEKLAPGGFLIVDDYWIPACRKATSDFRTAHNITEPIEEIGPIGAYWRKKR